MAVDHFVMKEVQIETQVVIVNKTIFEPSYIV